LWFLQKAHAQRFAVEGGKEFREMVTRITEAAEAKWSAEQLWVVIL
jgi:glutamyl-tRNA synthetase